VTNNDLNGNKNFYKKPFYEEKWFIAIIVAGLVIAAIVNFGGQIIAIYLLIFLLLAMVIQGVRTLFFVFQKDDKNIQKNSKIFAVIFGFSFFLVYLINVTTPEKDKVANNKTEVKKVEAKKEEVKKEEPKAEVRKLTEKEIEEISKKSETEKQNLKKKLEYYETKTYTLWLLMVEAMEKKDVVSVAEYSEVVADSYKKEKVAISQEKCAVTGDDLFDNACKKIIKEAEEAFKARYEAAKKINAWVKDLDSYKKEFQAKQAVSESERLYNVFVNSANFWLKKSDSEK